MSNYVEVGRFEGFVLFYEEPDAGAEVGKEKHVKDGLWGLEKNDVFEIGLDEDLLDTVEEFFEIKVAEDFYDQDVWKLIAEVLL